MVDYLPSSLICLTFGRSFNRSVDNLPNSIEHITFGVKFNNPVDHLPNSITHLSFGETFDQPIDHLPTSLKSVLLVDSCFTRSVDYLPSSLLTISFSYRFNCFVDHPLLLLILFALGSLINMWIIFLLPSPILLQGVALPMLLTTSLLFLHTSRLIVISI